MNENTEKGIGFHHFEYSLADLQSLRKWLQCNPGSIASGLGTFLSTRTPEPTLQASMEWLRQAEQIMANPDYPEQHFEFYSNRNTLQVERK